jgi:hypothetical protein
METLGRGRIDANVGAIPYVGQTLPEKRGSLA